jgi:hypothetical protein
MDLNSIAKQYLEAYYTTIMKNRESLLNFYSAHSVMTYNGNIFRGLTEIK